MVCGIEWIKINSRMMHAWICVMIALWNTFATDILSTARESPRLRLWWNWIPDARRYITPAPPSWWRANRLIWSTRGHRWRPLISLRQRRITREWRYPLSCSLSSRLFTAAHRSSAWPAPSPLSSPPSWRWEPEDLHRRPTMVDQRVFDHTLLHGLKVYKHAYIHLTHLRTLTLPPLSFPSKSLSAIPPLSLLWMLKLKKRLCSCDILTLVVM